jgi:two-component system sensor histidine kinase BaeS
MTKSPSLRLALALSYSLFALVIVVSVGLTLSARQEDAALHALQMQLKENAILLASSVDPSTFSSQQPLNIETLPAPLIEDLRIAYLRPGGKLVQAGAKALTATEEQAMASLGRLALSGQVVARETHGESNNQRESLYAAAPVIDGGGQAVGAVCLALPLEGFEGILTKSRSTLAWVGGGVMLASLIVGLLIAALLTRRLGEAEQLAARVADGDYSLRLPVSGPREMAGLARALNRMAAELQEQTRARQTVISNVTHELARPLGALRLGIESFNSGALSDVALADDMLDDMGRAVRSMEGVVEDLALAARPVLQPIALTMSPVSLEPLLRGLISRFWTQAEAHGIRLRLEIESSPGEVLADEGRLFQIMANLVENALKFTPAGGEVTIGARRSGRRVELIVRDSGPGISDHDREHLFEPFYQGEGGQRIKSGLGLGLAIARQLAVAHGGQLRLSNLPQGGTEANLSLPADRA